MHSEPTTIRFLDHKTRTHLQDKLKGWDVDYENMDDNQLLNAVTSYADDMGKLAVKKHVSNLKERLAVYAHGSTLTSPEFIDKLYHLSVPQQYLKLFHDQDYNFTASQIWERIRHSGIKPFDNPEEMLRPKYKISGQAHNL